MLEKIRPVSIEAMEKNSQTHICSKWIFFLIVAVFSISTAQSFCETIATTEDGKKIILHADGTWKPAQQEPISLKPDAEDFDFRCAKWGFSQEEVKKAEKSAPIMEKDGNLAYSDKISNQECLAVYIFIGNKLVRSSYRIVERHTNNFDYLLDYQRLKDLLTQKYGKPKDSKHIWKNSLYKDGKIED